MTRKMKTNRLIPLLAVLTLCLTKPFYAAEKPLFDTEEILDESTLDIKILQDWHPVGATRQKLIEINVAEWWPGQDYRIPVRMIVPLEGKAKGFSITGANGNLEALMKDTQPTDFQAKLLEGGVGIVKTLVRASRQLEGKRGLDQKMMREFMKDLDPRYTTLWIWSMTLMRATTAAYAETDYFEKGKVAGSGSSKNGMAPAVALINDERFTATCSNHAGAYYSPTRRAERQEIAKAEKANKAFFAAVKAGDLDLDERRARLFQRVMVGSGGGMRQMALKAGKSMDEMQNFSDRLWSRACVAENWDRLMERGVDILFEPGTHDYVAYDILWGAQNHPQVPVYYQPNGGHDQTPHVATAKDEQNREAFLWNHFFGGDPLLSPPTSSHEIEKGKLKVRVSFDEGPQPASGRIWWMYDRAPAGSAPFLHTPIPDDQWAEMERDSKTGSWIATIPLKEGASRIDYFSNHGHVANGYQQYLSSPYTRVELETEDAALSETLEEINDRFKNVDVQLVEWPADLQENLGGLKRIAFMATPVETRKGKLPLLIALHGGGGRNMSLNQQLERSAQVKGLGLAELAAKDLILLEPNTTATFDPTSLNTMLDYVLATYPEIDTNRIYLMGHSMGGIGTWTWINASPERFAAASPSGIGIGDSGNAQRLADLPIWGMVGGADNPDRIAGIKRMVERLREAGNQQVKYTEFPDANHAAANAAVFSSVELVDWMLGFSKN